MENSFKKMTHTRLVILWAFIISFGVFVASQFIAAPIAKVLINDFGIDFNTRQSVFKIVMLVISIIIMLLLNNGSLKDFGFTKPKTINYFRLVWLTIVVNVLSVLISSIVFLGVLNYFFPQDGLNYMVSEKNILTTIVTIWLLSSLSETVLTRGLFQSFLRNLKYIKFFKLSLPVILTGLYFGLLHITVFFAGKSIWFTFQLFFITSCTGIVAAYYREKSDSIFPAFLVHVLANVVGSVPLFLEM